MGQDSGGAPPATGTTPAKRTVLSADEVRAFTERAPRCKVAMQVLCTIPDENQGSEFVEAELVNVSSSGMLLANALLPIGAVVEFKFMLDARLVALAGRAEVVRALAEPPRMGLRFVMLDEAAQTLVRQQIGRAHV